MYDTIRFRTAPPISWTNISAMRIRRCYFAGSLIIGGTAWAAPGLHRYVLLHHYMGDTLRCGRRLGLRPWRHVRGGDQGAGLAPSRKRAATIRHYLGAGVEQILTRNGRGVGVALSDGTEFYASTVISNMDVKRTFLNTMDPKDLPGEFLKQVRNFKIRGSSGKLNITCVSTGCRNSRRSPGGAPCTRDDGHATDDDQDDGAGL